MIIVFVLGTENILTSAEKLLFIQDLNHLKLFFYKIVSNTYNMCTIYIT